MSCGKIAVYAICKNEIANLKRWITYVAGADYICVLDTGSSDGTWEELQKIAAKNSRFIIQQRTYDNWRFDAARNDSLRLVPKDAEVCVCIDLDEVIRPGWYNEIKRVWRTGEVPQQLIYLYAWNHNSKGEPQIVYKYNKIHDNSGGWKWIYPVHEKLSFQGEAPVNCHTMDGNKVWVDHWQTPDTNGVRESYIDLLQLRAKENPTSDMYGKMYLARTLFERQRYTECITFILNSVIPLTAYDNDFVSLPEAYVYMGRSYAKLGNVAAAENCLKASINFGSYLRMGYLELAQLYIDNQRYKEAIDIVHQCLEKSINTGVFNEMYNSYWTSYPYELLGMAYYYLRKFSVSLEYIELAKHLSVNELETAILENMYATVKAEAKKENK